ncbi:MAG: LON peptidase substrate-binding domain-containing protein [Pseudomonadales bacterium]|nr:peptidase S16 [Gammaproteobacteria bacterium]MDP6024753.1 LON peptidase substrate-binding domain-containing protein [Pseudomonadales bacterium]MDP6317323.1 LON peptidase substrate-binding domain-containing protein [Pseudomonadales bacterium]MDP7314450.1 LON peptidase substrate-binding domain-containing protein [Pseudomonadales bacterium]MDP7576246.1 LON peptidase substrate-binding domain-containing protein [Pseudomonadales bacterium]|tara:strand:+ start:3659 stop:4261 length:603 start_codon:yes stop_codon:yes gene_type:complete
MAEIPLFPLPMVLFPGGKLPLQIFEPRYLDMVKNCMREEIGFGVILIEEGQQVLKNAEQQLPSIAHCGTYCSIVDFDQQRNGLLQITVEGQTKFAVRDQYENPDRLMLAQVEFLPEEEDIPVPDNKQHLVNLLETLTQHKSVQQLGLSINFETARDVGGRLAELLPCPNDFKQRMLEMKNPVIRLSELERQLLRMQDSQL